MGCVAGPMPSNEVTLNNLSNPPDYKEMVDQLLLYCCNNVGIGSAAGVELFFKKYKKIFDPRLMAVSYYIKQHNMVTASFIEEDFDLPEATVYYILKKLCKMGIIKKGRTITRRNGTGILGGPRPRTYVWGEVTPEDVIRCRERHFKDAKPGIREASKITQLIIEQYCTPGQKNEIKFSQILTLTKKLAPEYHPVPIAEEVAFNLHKLEVRIWR